MNSLTTIDWTLLGKELRIAALDAHEGELPSIDLAYSFLMENPECFSGGFEEEGWPAGMPPGPNEELCAAYYADGDDCL